MGRCGQAFLFAFLVLAVPSLTYGQNRTSTVKEPVLEGTVASGKKLYDRACSSCHGPSGTGSKKGPPFLHKVYHPGHHGDQAFFRAAQQGARAHHWPFGDMPPVRGLGTRDIEFIVDYVRALQKANGLF